MIKELTKLNRLQKQSIMLLMDSIVLVLILWLAFSVRLGYWFVPSDQLVILILCAPFLAVPIFIRFGLYRAIIRYIGLKALWTIFKAVSLYALVWGIISFMLAIDGIPRSVILINWLLAIVIISGIRIICTNHLLVQFFARADTYNFLLCSR